MGHTETSEARLCVNGEPRALGSARTVRDLLRELELAERPGIAVALNGAVVPRSRWSLQTLTAGDRVELVGAVQGG